MLRWQQVTPVTIFGMTVKMHRPIYTPKAVIRIPNLSYEFDHYAYLHLGSELYMYKILDINWEEYMEARGDIRELKSIIIPIAEES